MTLYNVDKYDSSWFLFCREWIWLYNATSLGSWYVMAALLIPHNLQSRQKRWWDWRKCKQHYYESGKENFLLCGNEDEACHVITSFLFSRFIMLGCLVWDDGQRGLSDSKSRQPPVSPAWSSWVGNWKSCYCWRRHGRRRGCDTGPSMSTHTLVEHKTMFPPEKEERKSCCGPINLPLAAAAPKKAYVVVHVTRRDPSIFHTLFDYHGSWLCRESIYKKKGGGGKIAFPLYDESIGTKGLNVRT